MQAIEAISKVKAAGEKASKRREVRRFSEAASVGENIRQGDIYIARIDSPPVGAKAIPVRLQLAEGETQGSRHILDSAEGVTMFEAPIDGVAEYLVGPILVLTRERTITHPEHVHVVCPPGVYRVTYQRSLDREEQEIRALD